MRAIINARVLPMTRPEAEARAIAWGGDEILAVGGDDEIQALAASRGVRPEDGQGRVILPGFVDAHMHFLHVGLKRIRPDLRGAGSKQEALDRLQDWLKAHPGTDAVTAEGWDESEWDGWESEGGGESEGRAASQGRAEDPGRGQGRAERERRPESEGAAMATPFHRTELDAVAGVRPLVARRICGHVAYANSAALPSITARWGSATDGGRPLVDQDTGQLIEAPSLYLNEVLPASAQQLDAAVQRACLVAHRLGVTTVGDYEQAPLRAALERAAQAGRLGVRIVCSIYMQHLEQAVSEGFRTGRLVAPMMHDGGLKVFLDGSIGGHTARMLEPYDDEPGRGLANHGDDELDDVMARAHGAGVQIHAHAIGDGAVEQGLQAYERLAARVGQKGTSAPPLGVDVGSQRAAHRFEHFEIVHDGQIERAAALGLWASSQPNFVGEWSAKGGMYETRIGDRYRLNNRFRSYLDHGMRLACGSDGMPFGPLFGIACAVDHPDPAQRLDVREAVWHYTHEAAASLVQDDVGSLAPGKKADLLILGQKDLEAPTTQWTIAETIVGGQTVHRGSRRAPTDDDVEL